MQTKTPWFLRHNYSYYKLPKPLLTDPRYAALSNEAKIVYSIFLDRTGLSYKNGDKWRDAGGDPFIIFPQTEVAKMLHCGHDKATKVLSELVQFKLVRRDPPKRGQPSRLFVLPFAGVCEKTAANKTDESPDISQTHLSKASVRGQIKENISYSVLQESQSTDMLDTIVSIMTELVCQPKASVKIGERVWERQELADHMLSLDQILIEYVFDLLKFNQTEPKHPRNYLKSILCDADNGTMQFYYASRVNHDLHRSG